MITTIRNWLDGWQVNYLESPERFQQFMKSAGFKNISFSDISKLTVHSSKRLYKFYFLANLYLALENNHIFQPCHGNAKEKYCRL